MAAQVQIEDFLASDDIRLPLTTMNKLTLTSLAVGLDSKHPSGLCTRFLHQFKVQSAVIDRQIR